MMLLFRRITHAIFLKSVFGGLLGAIGLGIARGMGRIITSLLGNRLIPFASSLRLLAPFVSEIFNLESKLLLFFRSIFSQAGVGDFQKGAGTRIVDDILHRRGRNWRNVLIAGVSGAVFVGLTILDVPLMSKVKDFDIHILPVPAKWNKFIEYLKKSVFARPTFIHLSSITLPCGDDASSNYLKVEKDFSLIPGTQEHKQNRWKVYKANGGTWDYEHWSRVYDANMEKANRSHELVERYRQRLNWKSSLTQYSVDTPSGVRIIDIADPKTLKAIEHKTTTKTDGSRGYFSRDPHIREEIEKDRYLIEIEGWDITWVFENADASLPLIDELKEAGIKVEFR